MKTTKAAAKKLITLNPALVKEAQQIDQQLRQQWGAFKLARRAFGELCLRIKTKRLHRFIDNPKSRKHYVSLWAYVHSVTGGEISRATVYDAMRIAKLTKGKHAIPAHVVDKMPVGNAVKLAQVAPHKRLHLVKKATTEKPAEFSKTAAKAEGKTALTTFSRKLHPLVAAKLAKTIASFVPDKAEGNLTREETGVVAMCAAAERGRKIQPKKAA